jgi:hypothetical protein
MHTLTRCCAALFLTGAANFASASLISFEFHQDGFASGGSVSGSFRGRDLDGDGRLYAVSRGISNIFGLPFGNELDYAEVTFSGFGTLPGPSTVVYDRSVADMENPRNLFMAFAYNIDGGALGDEPDEGMSLSIFSPSTNYLVGDLFEFIFANQVSQSIGSCGVDPLCSTVVSLVPDPSEAIGARVVFEDFSGNDVKTTEVPLPGGFSLLLAGLGGAVVARRRSRFPVLGVDDAEPLSAGLTRYGKTRG